MDGFDSFLFLFLFLTQVFTNMILIIQISAIKKIISPKKLNLRFEEIRDIFTSLKLGGVLCDDSLM